MEESASFSRASKVVLFISQVRYNAFSLLSYGRTRLFLCHAEVAVGKGQNNCHYYHRAIVNQQLRWAVPLIRITQIWMGQKYSSFIVAKSKFHSFILFYAPNNKQSK